jgi:hypothetical protein
MSAVYHLLYGCFTAICGSCKIFDRKKKTETHNFSDEMILPQKPRSNSISEKEKKHILQKYQYMMKIKKEKKESEKDPTEKVCLSCYCFSCFPFFEQNTENSKTI